MPIFIFQELIFLLIERNSSMNRISPESSDCIAIDFPLCQLSGAFRSQFRIQAALNDGEDALLVGSLMRR